jgi:N-acetyltransferase 10
VEKWLNTLLCLDATIPKSSLRGCPHPSKCELFMVDRDALFSFNPVSEKLLQNMMALYVASHYKNTPNDLQLMSDAPAHQLYVLVAPVAEDTGRVPEPLCVIQVALEGQISRESVMQSLSRGQRASGDLIPWLVSQQFQDDEFASLSGARVVRIATNPDYVSMGYGSRALELLNDFYEGKFVNLSGKDLREPERMVRVTDDELESSTLLQDNVKVRDKEYMPPLFYRLWEIKPPQLDYVGVSYGLTPALHKFWNRARFVPVYLRQTANELTGEHSCVMIRTLEGVTDSAWLSAFARDFHRRFLTLLSYQFRSFRVDTSLSIEASASSGAKNGSASDKAMTKAELDELWSPFDLKRLDKYAQQMVDYHLIVDLLPTVATLYFTHRFGTSISLSLIQQAILLGIGLQRKTLEEIEKELNLPSSQLMGIFVKVMRKFSTYFQALISGAIADTMPTLDRDGDSFEGGEQFEQLRLNPITQSFDDELAEGIDEVHMEERERMKSMIDALPLDR